MSIRRALVSVTAGLIVGAVALGLLPFLAIFSWSELSGLSEVDSSPLFLLLNKLYKKTGAKQNIGAEGEGEGE